MSGARAQRGAIFGDPCAQPLEVTTALITVSRFSEPFKVVELGLKDPGQALGGARQGPTTIRPLVVVRNTERRRVVVSRARALISTGLFGLEEMRLHLCVPFRMRQVAFLSRGMEAILNAAPLSTLSRTAPHTRRRHRHQLSPLRFQGRVVVALRFRPRRLALRKPRLNSQRLKAVAAGRGSLQPARSVTKPERPRSRNAPPWVGRSKLPSIAEPPSGRPRGDALDAPAQKTPSSRVVFVAT